MTQSIRVWDLPVRIFHWSLASGLALAFITAEQSHRIHRYVGFTIISLVLFRLVWGVIGTRYARFSQFVTGPRQTAQYLGQLAKGSAPRHVGHNPAGAAMIIALLVAISATAMLGLMLWGHDGHGPFAGTFLVQFRERTLEHWHEFMANTTLFLVGFHVAGVLVSSWLHRENLVRAMLTGRKPVEISKADAMPPAAPTQQA